MENDGVVSVICQKVERSSCIFLGSWSYHGEYDVIGIRMRKTCPCIEADRQPFTRKNVQSSIRDLCCPILTVAGHDHRNLTICVSVMLPLDISCYFFAVDGWFAMV